MGAEVTGMQNRAVVSHVVVDGRVKFIFALERVGVPVIAAAGYDLFEAAAQAFRGLRA